MNINQHAPKLTCFENGAYALVRISQEEVESVIKSCITFLKLVQARLSSSHLLSDSLVCNNCKGMSIQNPSQCFIITDAGGLNDSAMERIPAVIYKLLKKSNFNLRQMENSNELLLTIYSPSIIEPDFENRMMECLEMDGSLVNVIKVELASILTMKFEGKRDFDEVMVDLRTKDVFKDQIGNTKYINALLGKKDLLMVLVVLHSNFGIGSLYSDFCLIEGLVTVYRVKSLEFLKVFFGKCGTLENYIEKIWSDSVSACKEAALNDSNYPRNIIPHHRTRVFWRTNPEKQECKTIAVVGEYASEKCELLHRFCHELTAEDCNLTVNRDNKEVTITGKNIKMLRKSVFMIQLQFKSFHCEEILNMSKTFFNILTQNSNMKKHFTRILAENKLDSVILLENGQKKPAVLGLNKFKTKNFIEWFEKFFSKESTKLELFQTKVEQEELEKCFTSLEVNSQSSADTTNAKMFFRSLEANESNNLSSDRRYSETTPIFSSSLKPCFQVSTTPMKTYAPTFEFGLSLEKSPISTSTCCRSCLSTKPTISNFKQPVPLSLTQAKFKTPALVTASSVPSKSPSTILSTIVTSVSASSTQHQAPRKSASLTNKPASRSNRNLTSNNLNYSSSLPSYSNASAPKRHTIISVKTSDCHNQPRCRLPSPSQFLSNQFNSFQEHTLSPKVTIATSPGKSISMLPSKPMISSASTSQTSSAVSACATSESIKSKTPITAHKEHFTSTISNLNCPSSPSTKSDNSAATLECKFSSIIWETPRSVKTQGQIGSLIQTSMTLSVPHSNTLSSKALISCSSTSALKPQCTSAPLSSNPAVSSKQICCPSSPSINTSKKLNVRTSPVTLSDFPRPSPQNTASTFALASENRCFDKTKGVSSKLLEKDRNPALPLKISLSTTSSQTVSRNYICPSSTSVKTSTPSKNSLVHVLKERRNDANTSSSANPMRESSITPSTTYIHYRIAREWLRFELTEPYQSESFNHSATDGKNAMYTVLKPRPAIKSPRRHLATHSSSSTATNSIPHQSPKSARLNAKALKPRPRLTELLHVSIREFVHINAGEMLSIYFSVKFLLLVYKTLSNAI